MVLDLGALKPHGIQVFLLASSRVLQPFAITSIYAYFPEMIESFGKSSVETGRWMGFIAAAFLISKAIMALPWISISSATGAKIPICLALALGFISSLLLSFAQSVSWTIICVILAGCSEAAIGLIRSTAASFSSRTDFRATVFVILPLATASGTVLGPFAGAALTRPADKWPVLFSKESFWSIHPYALPNLFVGTLLLAQTLVFTTFFKTNARDDIPESETSLKDAEVAEDHEEYQRTSSVDEGNEKSFRASAIDIADPFFEGSLHAMPEKSSLKGRIKRMLSGFHSLTKHTTFRWRFLKNPYLIVFSLSTFHFAPSDHMLPVFLHLPGSSEHQGDVRGTSFVQGGLGMSVSKIGIFLTAYGVSGIIIQTLVHPALLKRYGAYRCFSSALFVPIIVYLLMPFTTCLPDGTFWQDSIVFILMLFKIGGTSITVSCMLILLTESVEPEDAGAIHGTNTSTAALCGAFGSMLIGMTFSVGAQLGNSIIPWWSLCACATATLVVGKWLGL